MKNIYEVINKKLDIDLGNSKYLKNIPNYLLGVCANILEAKLLGGVEILVYEKVEDIVDIKSVKVVKGEKFNINSLQTLGYSKVSRVWNVNEYSVLGDVLIFWKKGDSFVVRVSFDGDIVERISILDPDSRGLIKDISTINFGSSTGYVSRVSSTNSQEIVHSFKYVRGGNQDIVGIDLGIKSFPGERFEQIKKIIKSYIASGFEVYISSDYFSELDIDGCIQIEGGMERGFVLPNLKIAVVTEFELSGKIDLNQNLKKKSKGKDKLFSLISKGDFVVHKDHGIGIYEDIVMQDGNAYMDIHYAGNDRLLVPVDSASEYLDRYVGSGGGDPKLTGLTSGVWGRIKSKARESIMAIASELVALYAMRKLSKGIKLVNNEQDIVDLEGFVDDFEYDDTEDQVLITKEIVSDLSRDIPMDRLIVGDVGFGKTELAIRALFIAVNSGHQGAILVPTTVLSMQHYKVIKKRFESYPFSVAVLNRFTTSKAREEILRKLENGNIDIIIGTHSLLTDSVKFKNLALLVIDEEQKFGVSQKEKLKEKRLDVHTLSMTATPIPRTLNMAISGIRDLSILSSVPFGRKSIINYFGEYNFDIVMKAISQEVGRGGQVYYMHNRISDLGSIKEGLLDANPTLKVGILHGKMGIVKISEVMSEFAIGNIDVLVCSSIIENGLDMPNVNTIIVDDSVNYGLSSLYQIRGRVGRSNRQAYAYFLYNRVKGLAQLRLDALEEANNIGSGFILSNRDLEIRGAGNILGKSQSGSINSVGYAMYTQMLEESIATLQGRKY